MGVERERKHAWRPELYKNKQVKQIDHMNRMDLDRIPKSIFNNQPEGK